MATYKKYNLTDKQIRELANVFHTEQGNVPGVKACASHACNYLEKWKSTVYKNPYDAVLYSGWWGSETLNRQRMAVNCASTAEIEGVGEVIRDGKRTLPAYVDEYDWLYDIVSAKNNGVAIDPLDRTKYKKDVTVVKNKYGSTWTFYCFPDGASGYCDPFGYISKPAGSSSEKPIQNETTYKTEYNLETVKMGSASASVIILQSVLFAEGYLGANGKPVAVDGEAGNNTIFALKHFQEASGLTADGVCKTKTWDKIIKGLKA